MWCPKSAHRGHRPGRVLSTTFGLKTASRAGNGWPAPYLAPPGKWRPWRGHSGSCDPIVKSPFGAAAFRCRPPMVGRAQRNGHKLPPNSWARWVFHQTPRGWPSTTATSATTTYTSLCFAPCPAGRYGPESTAHAVPSPLAPSWRLATSYLRMTDRQGRKTRRRDPKLKFLNVSRKEEPQK